ncbi:uncharacterized protein BDR25DRAFT_278511 [Lindgomyces ingoldianus]|uniref:Uncharacterized protein n=1 Tax=Lindgomyces ingoldianus TaxID=673940 RepID=A0ACB6RBW4_9PLEO|nr:uncharacterized protein BDR25DRAFT_278511 [Lindgomyces ingoldianus]KAF2475822.1 hypothetical protein BDR25DRAFT_278511 [Lindgomyces ingoldianus]
MNQLPNYLPSPSTDRWEELKPIIEQLYLKEKKKLADVVRILKNAHGFDAVDHQYKHHFKKWQWKKNIPKSKKDKIAEQLESRARAGKAGTSIALQGRTVELHKIRRHMKMKARAESGAMVLKKPSGIESVVAGHVDISVATPSATSPQNAPSPTGLFLKEKAAIDRAHLFAQGQHDKLLMSMNGEERRVMLEWLYQYWFFCFKTAKNWGKGPPAWTEKLLDFARYHPHSRRSLPGTPQDPMPQSEAQPGDYPTPTSFCRWFIHVRPDWPDYQEIPDEEVSRDSTGQDPDDESTWLPWPNDWQEPPLPIRLRDALEHNDFSSISSTILPVAIPQIAKAAQRSPDELLLESLGFSIMARNLAQVESIIQQLRRKNIDFTWLYPLHMTTSYLDGYKTCCDIFGTLLSWVGSQKLSEMFVNELGHTVLDNLMISILKSHSSVMPVVVDDTLKDTARFAGEEIDICGRWDADSPCVRHLLTKGNPSTPFSWKHKFCHTSIQTICHCIIQMHHKTPSRLMRTASGLYGRRCFDCGMKLQLQPLHSLVMTAYHLASSGCQDEDLFGMLACLLCFISCGLDPRKTASVSFALFMQTIPSEIACAHEELTPAELAEKISTYSVSNSWSAQVQSGWAVFCGVLRLCEDIHVEPERDGDDVTMEDYQDSSRHIIGNHDLGNELLHLHLRSHNLVPCFRTRKDLATLWASVQAELLTYRRLDDSMDWISQYFSMDELRHQLDQGEPLSVKYAEQDLLQPHCICGSFNCYPLATLSDATEPDIANLDIWERATYGVILDD